MDNLSVYKKGLAFLGTVILGISPYNYAKADFTNKGDSVITTKVVNMRYGPSTETFKLGEVPRGEICDRILSIDGFNLVRYNGRIFFLSGDFTDSNITDYNNDYYYVEQDNDIIRTTTDVYFRLGPSINEQDICLLDKDEELIVLGKSYNYSDPNDVWYLAKRNGEIGFIKAQYTESLKSSIQKFNPEINNIEVQKMGYLETDSSLYDAQGSYIQNIDQYQVVKILSDKDNNYIVSYNGRVGTLPKSSVSVADGIFVVVDLSDQKIFMYSGNECVFESVCTTGWDKRPTDIGAFKIYEKGNHRFFSEDHQARYLWANFDNGNGIHDAPWEQEKNFGSNKFRKHNGSNGCVRVPDNTAKFLTKHIYKGNRVIVKR